MNLRPSRGVSINCFTGIMSLMAGIHAFLLCFMAETTVFSMRSTRILRRSENCPSKNDISSMPISVAFSAIHSMRSIIFVGAMAMCILFSDCGTVVVLVILYWHCLFVAMVTSAWCIPPSPSIRNMLSPSFSLSTRVAWAASSWGSLSTSVAFGT